MDLYGRIYIIVCLICVIVLSHALHTKSLKNQRRNSKMAKEFPDPRSPIKDFTRDDKFLQQRVNMSNEIDDISDVHPKIINGRAAREAEFPWMVALHFNGRFICSAFLIAPNLVMTAAHCVEFNNGVEPAASFFGIIGNINRKGENTRIEFSEVSSHPDYGTGGSEGDIAIFRIAEPLELSDSIQPICLPAGHRDFDLIYSNAMGWGVTSNTAEGAPETLRTTELSVQHRSLCQIFFAFMMISITDRHVCTSAASETGVCFGDSGGPLVHEDPQAGVPLAIGVASFVTIFGCGRPMVPSVYTSTAAYADWIKETVGPANEICFI